MFLDIKVSIGVPIFNGAKTLENALNTLINQTHYNIEIIISDNNSSDDTFKICSKYAEKDDRIILFKQNLTLTPVENFKFVLDHSCGEYFMWAADDDRWSKDFITENLKMLLNNKNAVGSIGKVYFNDSNGNTFNAKGDYPILGSKCERIKHFLSNPADNSRIYSLFKRKVIKDINFEDYKFHAADWLFTILTLIKGEHLQSENCEMYRSAPETDKYYENFNRDNSNHLSFGIPLLPLTLRFIKEIGIINSTRYIKYLFNINKFMYIHYKEKRKSQLC